MHLIPTQDEVVSVLRETGALRDGHFQYPTGLHSNEYLQVPLAMRYYQYQRMLSVGLSRLLRANHEIRAIIPQLSIVAPDTAGLSSFWKAAALWWLPWPWSSTSQPLRPLTSGPFLFTISPASRPAITRMVHIANCANKGCRWKWCGSRHQVGNPHGKNERFFT